MNAQTGTAQDRERWYLLLDPHWTPVEEDGTPPIEAVAGAWPVGADREVGLFQPNLDFAPVDANLPTDPIDAVLRELAEGRGEPEQVQVLLRECLVFQAMNGDGRPLVMDAPDGLPCVVLATAAPHLARIDSPAWRRVDLADLVERLGRGIDVLFNPDGPAAVRLAGDFVRAGLTMSDEEAAVYEPFTGTEGGLYVLPWDGDAGPVGPDGGQS
ncbi:hypothetical protein ATK30_0335 [Amycolatopsis echigonensis]|uniref:Type III secretion system (T3SS) SseB-like protein n=1 Tax=Amycolatopsis echigonensis TaxID=2576905 RepID=A0A2N3X2A3_9PSEU|nr:type VII secretion system-associated protein [Amycolatopsis niigatensis]PKW00240.1 hypothetical protein ATK30_0335 [Amycolatopsis niigatensis]